MLIERAYNRSEAVRYASIWATSRNPEYYDFEDIGGDCTNFASQCVYSGAGVMNYTPTFGWYYVNLDNRSPSWSGVEFFYDFLVKNKGAGPFASEVSRQEIEPGDVVQLGTDCGDWYHTPVVTAVKNGLILVAAHTLDAYNRPLNTYSYGKIRYLHIKGVRSPS